MRADDDGRLPRRHGPSHDLALAAFVATGQQGYGHASRRAEWGQHLVVLAGEDLGRRHQAGLGTRLDGDQHGEQGNDCLAAADVPLQQA